MHVYAGDIAARAGRQPHFRDVPSSLWAHGESKIENGFGRPVWLPGVAYAQPMMRPASKHERALPAMPAAPGVQLGFGLAALLATAGAVRHDRVGPREVRAFRAVNGSPDSVYLPAWAVMQLGAFGAIPASAAAAWLAGDGELAARLPIGGTGTWALAKAVKRIVRRPRPVTLLPGIRRRGRDASGLGYLSGHAGVAVVLGVAALPRLGPGGRALTLTAMPLVGTGAVSTSAPIFRSTSQAGRHSGLAVNAAAGTAAVRRYSTSGIVANSQTKARSRGTWVAERCSLMQAGLHPPIRWQWPAASGTDPRPAAEIACRDP